MLRHLALAGVLVALLAAGPRAHSVTYDRRSLLIDGKPAYVWSGEFHYWRLPSPDLWRDVLEKIHAAGFNAVSIYFDWAYHSSAPHRYDFHGVRDVDRLLDIASRVGIYVIARPGPYINAETDSGGFPGWLQNLNGRARTSAPDYLSAALEWYAKIDPIIARHQWTNGTGTVILYQVENEYIGNGVDRAYMAALERKARADGITVPLTHNSCCGDGGRWSRGIGAVDIDGYDSYPQGFDCTHPQRWAGLPIREFAETLKAIGNSPFFLLEEQGGAFDPWGGPGYQACRELTDSAFERVFEEFNIAQGATLQNFYMTYGGTSWGWLPTPSVYSSYDYGAILDEARRLSPKYGAQKLLAYEMRALWPLSSAVREQPPALINPVLHVDARVNSRTKTQFFIVRHENVAATTDDRGTLAAVVDGRPYRIPVRINGRDSQLILAGFPLGDARLVYSTSELEAYMRLGDEDVALLFGRAGETGRTVLRFPRGGDRMLTYRYGALQRILVKPPRLGEHALQLLIADDSAAAAFWACTAPHAKFLVRGPYLLRSCAIAGNELALEGDTTAPTPLEAFVPPSVDSISWNGAHLETTRTQGGTLRALLPGPGTVALPALANWRIHDESPEREPRFDDTAWAAAGGGTLNADRYGFHYGDVWYRGRFTATGTERSVSIDAMTGVAGAFTVWLNGVFLGSKEADANGRARDQYTIPAAALHAGNNDVLAILLENSGHDEDFSYDEDFKQPRGITRVAVSGAPEIAWRIQGNVERDPVRGPMNTGGLYGERFGWYLPGYPDSTWKRTDGHSNASGAGVTWYRTHFSLHLSRNKDAAIALQIDDDTSREYRALIYLNGWLVGRYVNDVGPQDRFVLPNGILRTDGTNTLAVAQWSLDPDSTGLGRLSLKLLANTLSSLRVRDVPSPTYGDLFR